eukprot:TRINITY_DN2372_c0_g1_i1.p1 TRINITY_DN2372_c0_g1~~TRINITY_DN2372_c0_g1_i1.p1  ORF type:complete len:774 (+),score=189.76 TRINITY_DN2372_c0_g1_i1:30-2324(+)
MDNLIQRSRQSCEDLQNLSFHENFLNMSQVASHSRNLLSETTEGIEGTSINRGLRLLYQLDVDIGKASELLEEVKIAFTPEHQGTALKSSGNLQSYLEATQQETFLSLVDLAQRTALDSFQNNQSSFINSQWNSLKVEIMEGVSSNSEVVGSSSRIRRSPETEPFKRAVVETLPPVGGTTYEARVNSVLERWLSTLSGQSLSSWELLQNMLPTTRTTEFERTNGAIKHLQSQYRSIMIDIVRRRREYVKPGSNPEPIVFCQAYLRCILMDSNNEWPIGCHEIQDNHPFWPQIFHLLRIGEYDAAIRVANMNQKDNVVLFTRALTEWVIDRKVTESLRIETQRHFNALVANQTLASAANTHGNVDLYEIVCYGLVSGANLDEIEIDILDRVENWIWYRLCIDENLELLRQTLLEAGFEHFGTNYLLYFSLLLIVQGFAPAIAFLKKHNLEDAVHFGIFMNSRHVLRISDSLDDPILNETSNIINYAKLIQTYTSTFAMTDPRRAAVYLLLLQAESLVTPCITNLIINCKEFGFFLGKSPLLGETSVQHPFLRPLVSSEQFRLVAESVANWCQNAGYFVQAISLYDIAGRTEYAIEILTRHISLLLLGTSENKEEIKSMGETILNHIRRSPSHAKYHQESHLLHIMLKLMDFFKFYENKDLDNALNVIIDLDILPLRPNDAVELYVNKFVKSPILLQQRIGDILSAMVAILLEQYSIHKDNQYNETFINSLKIKGRQIVQFGGRINAGLKPEVTSALMQLEICFSY